MPNEYDTGDLIRCTGTFTDADGDLLDPTSVFAQVKDPSGNITSYEYLVDAVLVRDSQGVYHIDVDLDEAGDWFHRFYSTGTGQASGEEKIWVKVSHFS